MNKICWLGVVAFAWMLMGCQRDSANTGTDSDWVAGTESSSSGAEVGTGGSESRGGEGVFPGPGNAEESSESGSGEQSSSTGGETGSSGGEEGSTGGTEEGSTGGTEEGSTGGTEEGSTGGTEEGSTGGTEEGSTSGGEEGGFITTPYCMFGVCATDADCMENTCIDYAGFSKSQGAGICLGGVLCSDHEDCTDSDLDTCYFPEGAAIGSCIAGCTADAECVAELGAKGKCVISNGVSFCSDVYCAVDSDCPDYGGGSVSLCVQDPCDGIADPLGLCKIQGCQSDLDCSSPTTCKTCGGTSSCQFECSQKMECQEVLGLDGYLCDVAKGLCYQPGSQCAQDGDCGTNQVCKQDGAGPCSLGYCQNACVSDGECSSTSGGALPICLNGHCVGCEKDGDCEDLYGCVTPEVQTGCPGSTAAYCAYKGCKNDQDCRDALESGSVFLASYSLEDTDHMKCVYADTNNGNPGNWGSCAWSCTDDASCASAANQEDHWLNTLYAGIADELTCESSSIQNFSSCVPGPCESEGDCDALREAMEVSSGSGSAYWDSLHSSTNICVDFVME